MIAGVDVAKLIFSIFVVGIHTHPFDKNVGAIKDVADFLFGLAVPFFFISSSYFLFSKPVNSSLERRRNINRYALRLVKLYLLWTAIYLPITLYEYSVNGKGVIHNAASFFRMLLLVGEHYFSWPLWYLLASIYGMLILKLFIDRKFSLPIASIAVLVLSEFVSQLSIGAMDLGVYTQKVSEIIKHSLSNGRILSALPYLAAGYYLTRPMSRSAVWGFYALGAVGGVLLMLKIPYISAMSMVVVSIAFFLAARGVRLKPSALFPNLRRASTVVYFTHMYFYFFLSLAVGNLDWYGWVPFVSATCASLMFALLVIKTEAKVGVFRFIFG